MFNPRPDILDEAQKAKFKPNVVIQILIFAAIYVICQIAAAIPVFVITFISVFKGAVSGTLTDIQDPNALAALTNDLTLPMLFSTIIMIILVIIYCRFIEKRSLYSMGFVKKRAVLDYLIGIAVGFVLIAVTTLIAFLCGALEYNGFVLGNGLGLLLLFLIGFIIQGASEEIFLRGYFMVSLSSRTSLIVAVLVNSVVFALLHIFNDNVSVLGLVNIAIFGIFASVYALKTNSIWGVCAAHSIWNFAQGNIFGIKVSGIDTQVSLFSFAPKSAGGLISGGAFGLEGGLSATVVLVVAIVIVLLLARKPIAHSVNEEDVA